MRQRDKGIAYFIASQVYALRRRLLEEEGAACNCRGAQGRVQYAVEQSHLDEAIHCIRRRKKRPGPYFPRRLSGWPPPRCLRDGETRGAARAEWRPSR